MFRHTLISLIFCAIISSTNSQQFCNKKYSHKLFDKIFSYEDMVYVFRDDRFWIMKYSADSDLWTQTAGPLKKSQIFKDMDEGLKFDTIFVIERYDYDCKSQKEKDKTFQCRNADIGFNVVDITFVFSGDKYLIYRRIDELHFELNDNEYYYVPWLADTHQEKKIVQILEALNTTVFGAVVKQSGDGLSPPSVALLTEDAIYEYYILDKKPEYYILRVAIVLDLEKFRGHNKDGGIRYQNKGLFFINGDVVQYTKTSLIDWNLNYWDFFCLNKRVTTTVKTPDSNEKTPTKVFKPFETFKTRTAKTTTPGTQSRDKANDDYGDNTSEDTPPDGPTDGPNDGPTDGPPDGPTDGPNDGPTDGPPDGPTDGPNDGPTDGPNDGPTDGPNDGSTDDPNDGPTDGPNDGSTDDPNDGPTDGPPDGPTDGPNDGPTDGPNDGPTDGPADNSTSEVPEDETIPGDNTTYDWSNLPDDGYTPPFPPPDAPAENSTYIPDEPTESSTFPTEGDDGFFPREPFSPRQGEFPTTESSYKRNKELYGNLSIILFVSTLITAVIVVSFAIFGFVYISAEL